MDMPLYSGIFRANNNRAGSHSTLIQGLLNMSIKNSDWVAQINRMPGDLFFRVYGTVTVATPGIVPILVLSPLQDKSFDLRLELKLVNSGEITLQVETEKAVTYKHPGNSNVSSVSIFFEGKPLHHIKEVMITH
jgi:hypothetical protein